jgi:pSer/pThr/pTyr-binding forkhead associated (FHA) protein
MAPRCSIQSEVRKTNMTEKDVPILVAINGPLKGERWLLERPLVVGREPGCDVVIPDRQVSRYHARLTPGANGVVLEDLGSKNGTHYNGNPLSGQVVLQDGDTLQIAVAQEFQFLNSDATMPLDAEPVRSSRLMLDMRARQVWVNQKQMTPPLSAQQFQLVWVLYQNEGKVVTRQELISAVWGDEQSAGVTDQALDALIRRLRDRLTAMDPDNEYVVTIRGHGMMLKNPDME